MTSFEFYVESLFDGNAFHSRQKVVVEGGCIRAIGEAPKEVDCLPGLLTAGFIDWQVNGGGGVLFNHAPNVMTLSIIAAAHARFGSVGLLPTLITDSYQKMQAAADAVAAARQQGMKEILGIHFEGPHLSVAKKGVHSEQYIRSITEKDIELFCRDDLGVVVVTLAPENVSPEVISTLTERGVIVSLGHSNASFEQTKAALDAGACAFTHLYNAMSPLTSREPGMVGAALQSQAHYGLIMDGIHVHPAAAQAALKANPKMTLVTDAMSPVGSDENSFEFFGGSVVRDGDRLSDGQGRLAGSALDMASAVANTEKMLAIDKGLALNMGSQKVAEFLSVDDSLGSLSPGRKASMVLLDNAGKVVTTWVEGREVYRRHPS